MSVRDLLDLRQKQISEQYPSWLLIQNDYATATALLEQIQSCKLRPFPWPVCTEKLPLQSILFNDTNNIEQINHETE